MSYLLAEATSGVGVRTPFQERILVDRTLVVPLGNTEGLELGEDSLELLRTSARIHLRHFEELSPASNPAERSNFLRIGSDLVV